LPANFTEPQPGRAVHDAHLTPAKVSEQPLATQTGRIFLLSWKIAQLISNIACNLILRTGVKHINAGNLCS
jgi:hypothetical protein